MTIRYPAEILGVPIGKGHHHIDALSTPGRCPFLGAQCGKTNRTCSINANDQLVAICPHRFLEGEIVMRSVADQYFGSLHDLLVFKEVASGDQALGKFDYVIAHHRPMSNEIDDFVIVEFQTVDTTSTGKLNEALRDFVAGQNISERNYGFGINWSNVWKRCFTQILNKGRVLERWGQKSFWVVQEPAYKHLLDGYGLTNALRANADGTTVFMVVDIVIQELTPTLQLSRIQSSTVADLLLAFGANSAIPAKDRFVERLQARAQRNLALRLQWE